MWHQRFALLPLINSTTHDGFDRAEKLHLAESGLSDIIFTRSRGHDGQITKNIVADHVTACGVGTLF